MMMSQFRSDPAMCELVEQFKAFDRNNPTIWIHFRNFALRALHAGVPHYSADAILHRIRWHIEVETRGAGEVREQELKINNNHAAFYARKFREEYPRHADFFQIRHSKADGEIVGAAPQHNAAVNA
jgi:hypothetical protein